LKGRFQPKDTGEAAGPFLCVHCHNAVAGDADGTQHRNHCPRCLWSAHVDLRTGDRLCGCRGPMEPIAVWVRHDGEWAIVHRCTKCGALRSNRIAGDDNELALMSLAVRPLASPPFPLDQWEAWKKQS
jgi:DNA-directed RNA polymerase subunit RPC12/RpoP